LLDHSAWRCASSVHMVMWQRRVWRLADSGDTETVETETAVDNSAYFWGGDTGRLETIHSYGLRCLQSSQLAPLRRCRASRKNEISWGSYSGIKVGKPWWRHCSQWSNDVGSIPNIVVPLRPRPILPRTRNLTRDINPIRNIDILTLY
jgi:hypothetical protein